MDLINGESRQQAQSFRHSIIEILNHSSLALMISVGHRTGLFDTMKKMTPATAQEIAREAGLATRCVREWLGIMAVGGIIEYDPEGALYFLPSAHAALLSRLTQDHNLAVLTQWIAAAGAAEDDLTQCFTDGRPMPDARIRRLNDLISEESKQDAINTLFEQILPLMPRLIERLMHGTEVLALGCGDGGVLNTLAGTFPASHFAGYDHSGNKLEAARSEAHQLGLKNVVYHRLEPGELDDAAPEAHFDLIMVLDSMREQDSPEDLLAWIRKSLRPDGLLLIKELAATEHLEENGGDLQHSLGPFLYTRSSMVRMMSAPAREDEPPRQAAWDRAAAPEMLRSAGFRDVETFALPRDHQSQYIVALADPRCVQAAA